MNDRERFRHVMVGKRRVGGARRPRTRVLLFVAGAALVSGSAPFGATAQSFRGWAGTTVQAVELRPLEASASGCVPEVACYLPAGEQRSVIGTQDLSLTAWGFGVRGLSVTTFLRGRASAGAGLSWPRAQDRFDALLGFAQLARGSWTVRLGRQEIRSGLGFSSFDGARGTVRRDAWDLEGFVGRSLARGLRDPENEALRGIEDFVPDQGVRVLGGSLGARYGAASGTLRYQRELLADRSGLASERASLDGAASVSRVRLSGGVDWDFARAQPGKGHVSASTLLDGRWMISATARRYVPYFSLSTIWGFFEPVAYHELVGRASWSPTSALGAWLSGGVRRYEETGAPSVLRPLEDTGRRAQLGVAWNGWTAWTLRGEYQLEWGPGGFLNSADASARWRSGPRLDLTAHVMSFQQIEQYRLGDGRALGGGLSADLGVTERIDLVLGASVLRHRRASDAISPWNQSRAWSSVRVQLGSDPGLRNRVRR